MAGCPVQFTKNTIAMDESFLLHSNHISAAASSGVVLPLFLTFSGLWIMVPCKSSW